MFKIEVKVQFIFYPSIQCLNNRIVSRCSTSRHGTKYVILRMGLAKSLRRVDSSLVGVEDNLGPLLFFFSCESVQDHKTVIVRFAVTWNIANAVSKDLIVECIQTFNTVISETTISTGLDAFQCPRTSFGKSWLSSPGGWYVYFLALDRIPAFLQH